MSENRDDGEERAVVWARPEASTMDFHGAAIIDEAGHEIPITEDMIQRAFAELASWALAGCDHEGSTVQEAGSANEA